ncbi:MAG UNVERIFIED_CONTAM: hypothetical protein LVR29_01525 [Microcystis novacekii LVE1205-3]|jgi:hypothetical protein
MTKKADIGSKRLISLAPDNWARWLTQQPDVQAQEFLELRISMGESCLTMFS